MIEILCGSLVEVHLKGRWAGDIPSCVHQPESRKGQKELFASDSARQVKVDYKKIFCLSQGRSIGGSVVRGESCLENRRMHLG